MDPIAMDKSERSALGPPLVDAFNITCDPTLSKLELDDTLIWLPFALKLLPNFLL